MEPLKIVETEPGYFSLLLNAGDTEVDEVIESLDHEPNGYFWEGVATFLLLEHPDLGERLGFDSEGGMFCAHGQDRDALDQLGTLMATIANDGDATKTLLQAAKSAGHEFDD